MFIPYCIPKFDLFFRAGRVRQGAAEGGDGGTPKLVQAILVGRVTVEISTVPTKAIMTIKLFRGELVVRWFSLIYSNARLMNLLKESIMH